jgi:prevent-host-death family protein
MPSYSVAEAKDNLSALIDRALSGEEVIVTRHGKPVVRLDAVRPAPRPITQADLDWLDVRRVGSRLPQEDAGTQVSRMRDEDWAR